MKIIFNSFKFSVFLCFFFVSVSTVFSQNDVFEISRKGSLEDIQNIYNSNPQLITSQNDHGFTPLTLACYNGNLEVVKFLVSKLNDINTISKFGTPLMAAIYKGHIDIVKILLDHKADASLQDDKGETATHYAVFFKKHEIIKLLVESKASFEIKNKRDQTALDYAKLYNDKQINDLLNL